MQGNAKSKQGFFKKMFKSVTMLHMLLQKLSAAAYKGMKRHKNMSKINY